MITQATAARSSSNLRWRSTSAIVAGWAVAAAGSGVGAGVRGRHDLCVGVHLRQRAERRFVGR